MTSSISLSNLKKWCFENKFVIKYKDDKKYTHLLLDGGKICVPKEKINDFYKMYTIDLMNKKKNYICEMRTPIFKYFVDLDLIDVNKVKKEEITEIVRMIQKALSQFLKVSDTKRFIVVSTTDSKTVTVNDEEYVKTGVHLIWPRLKINIELALFLRDVLLQYLAKNYKKSFINDWEDIIDESVYKQNGLRMIGSHKMHKCKNCKGKHKLMTDCDKCFSTGKIDEGRPYMPILILDAYGNELKEKLDSYMKNKYKLIKRTSIQSNDQTTNIEIKEPYPEWFDLKNINKQNKVRLKKTNKQIYQVMDEENQIKYRKKINPNDRIYEQFEEFIKMIYPNIYSDIQILGVYLCGKEKDESKKGSKDTRYYVVRTNSNYCQNIEKEHNSNYIYFYVDKTTISQKCFCTCNSTKGRKHGLCSKYRSKCKNLSLKLKKSLYPDDYSPKIKPVIDEHNPKIQFLEWLEERL